VRKIAEDGMAETQRAVRMLCDELQMQEASYEMLVEERKMLLAQLTERDAEIKRLKADLVAEKEHWRMLCDVIAKFRDEARREVCELDANGSLEGGTPTTVAADRGWSYLYEQPSRLAALEDTAREMYKGGD
jgi:hypothetical protein